MSFKKCIFVPENKLRLRIENDILVIVCDILQYYEKSIVLVIGVAFCRQSVFNFDNVLSTS